MPIVFDPRRDVSGGRPKYLLVVMGGLVAGGLLLAADRPWRCNPLWWPVASLVGWTGLSAAASDHPDVVLAGFPGTYDGLWTTMALAAIFALAAATFDAASVRRLLTVLWLGTGAVVAAFGVAQLVDRLVSPESGWDWARPSISPWTIGSTLGNPNHLAAFLSMLLPVGIVLAICSGQRRMRVATAVLGVVVVGELAVTASRGGWLATFAGLAVLAVLLRHDLPWPRKTILRVTAGALGFSVAVMLVLSAAGATKIDVGTFLDAGRGTTIDLRREVWASALHMAADHPVVGVGPDAFPVAFPAYATFRFRELFGAFTVANGAHNLFLNVLANLGAGGLLALLAVLGTATLVVRRTWRRLSGEEGREPRLLLAGLTAALVSYVVQASVNVQPVALSLCFWVLLGLTVARLGPAEVER